MDFLPICKNDMVKRGWDYLDFLFISGDAYVDHPAFGAALLTRLLEAQGYKVGIIARPDLDDDQALLVMGRPLYGVFVSSGVVDSMVNNYTAAGRKRSEDRYAPGGIGASRPDRALIKYCNLVRKQLGDIPLVIGGVEASLRRFAHYDYWSDKVRRSILQDSQADLLVYGMGEQPLLAISDYLKQGVNVKKLHNIAGTCYFTSLDKLTGSCQQFVNKYKEGLVNQDQDFKVLPSFEQCLTNKRAYAQAFIEQYQEQDPGSGKVLIQWHGQKVLVQNPPQKPMDQASLDKVYALPFTRKAHYVYDKVGGVPALEEIRFSVNSHRGCFGGCNFCAITFHQGRIVQKRSSDSILSEIQALTKLDGFKGYIHDLGGPTANFHEPACHKQEEGTVCKERQCLYPRPCPSLRVSHSSYLDLLRKARQIEGVKKVFIRSGLRYDYLLLDEDQRFLTELCRYHVSGQLKVAPEHIASNALQAMGKPQADIYYRFKKIFEEENRKLQLKQYLVPYLISGHPGCTLDDAIELAIYIKKNRVLPEQVQDFYPTPGTISTTMYYTGLNPITMQTIHVPDRYEKKLQRALLQFSRPRNRKLALEALEKAGRTDLIGYGENCLLAHPQKHKKVVIKSGKKSSSKSNRKVKQSKNTYFALKRKRTRQKGVNRGNNVKR